MSPIEYIAEGIRQGNWETVCKGYERLTGIALSLPAEQLYSEQSNQTQQLHNVLQQIVNIASEALPTEETIVHSIIVEPKQPKRKKRGRPKTSGKKKIKKEIILDANDSTLQLDDNKKTVIQKKTDGVRFITNNPSSEEVEHNKIKAEKAKKNKLKLKRRSMETYKVKCNECEEIFESDRPDGEMGQKCSKCLRGKRSKLG
jgi:hypothetical protein